VKSTTSWGVVCLPAITHHATRRLATLQCFWVWRRICPPLAVAEASVAWRVVATSQTRPETSVQGIRESFDGIWCSSRSTPHWHWNVWLHVMDWHKIQSSSWSYFWCKWLRRRLLSWKYPEVASQLQLRRSCKISREASVIPRCFKHFSNLTQHWCSSYQIQVCERIFVFWRKRSP
jgi:hypothetical protein